MATKSNVVSTKSNVASTVLHVASTLLLVWTGPYAQFLIPSERCDSCFNGEPNCRVLTSLSSANVASCPSVHCPVKPRPHQQQRRSNIVECYKSNDYFDNGETNWSYTQFDSNLSKGRYFTKNSFDIVPKRRQQCRSNIRLCRKYRSTCSIRQRCFDIVSGVDGT